MSGKSLKQGQVIIAHYGCALVLLAYIFLLQEFYEVLGFKIILSIRTMICRYFLQLFLLMVLRYINAFLFWPFFHFLSQVLHNIAIVDNFHDGCSNPKKLLEVLNNVKVCVHMLVVALMYCYMLSSNSSILYHHIHGWGIFVCIGTNLQVLSMQKYVQMVLDNCTSILDLYGCNLHGYVISFITIYDYCLFFYFFNVVHVMGFLLSQTYYLGQGPKKKKKKKRWGIRKLVEYFRNIRYMGCF